MDVGLLHVVDEGSHIVVGKIELLPEFHRWRAVLWRTRHNPALQTDDHLPKMLHDSATIQANHERFVSRVAESEVVWGLQAPTGFAVCPSNDDEERQVLIFWSDRGYASRVKQNHFPEYEPVEISSSSNQVTRLGS